MHTQPLTTPCPCPSHPPFPQFGSGLTRAEVQGTWLGAIKNAGYWVINQGLQRVLALAEVRAFRKLRAKLGLPLSGEWV